MRSVYCVLACAASLMLAISIPIAVSPAAADSIDAAVAVGIGVANAGEVIEPEPPVLRWERRCGPNSCALHPVYAEPALAHGVRPAVGLAVLGAMIELAQPDRDSKNEASIDQGRARRARFFSRRR